MVIKKRLLGFLVYLNSCLISQSLQFTKIPTQAYQFQAEPCRCSRRVASIIGRIDLGCASNPMRVLISLTAPFQKINILLPM